ncbi:hypothetical protein CLOBY_17990 [Clostridium saccharobutylicum]|nr:hypothetical protein [Clostridium saccharobutylicum]AQS09668.1 hypothetical protein CLOBY_17990 [Clostridium saccharobutylicum]MBC2436937.1 hypothetical protein [Clostridium saccharobutylicum]NSB89288.1 hypothetical protein [Clostridium saccharobutylicum]NYC27942.1 hypothetical protein [Clostridium saccharobutylicum]OOM17137.1 hypothetical protein CLSAB_20850 [Clostridium saccharobutylicum]
MNISKKDKAEIKGILNKLADQINIIEMQCDNVMEIMADLNKDLNENEGE